MSPVRLLRKKIGELLLERGVIAQKQLESALREQQVKGGYISQHLIALGYADEYAIANCLSSQYGFPYLPLRNYIIPHEILDIIPLKFIKVYSLMPVDKIGDMLTITMADPLNDGVIEMVRQITNCDVEVFISTYDDINVAMRQYYGDKLKALVAQGLSEEDLLKEGITEPFIQTIGYKGAERRRFKRIEVNLEVNYFLQGKPFKGKVTNLSCIGAFFICDSFIPIGTDVLCKITLKKEYIDAVVQVARVERIKEVQVVEDYEITKWDYGIAGFFNFITDEDRAKLVPFLKQAGKH